jgi:hypothetical protein
MHRIQSCYKNHETHQNNTTFNLTKILSLNFIISGYNRATWIGASRNTSGGIFYWEDGTPILDYFVKWGASQPQDQECVLLLSWEDAWSWHDYGCHDLFWSLCEFD